VLYSCNKLGTTIILSHSLPFSPILSHSLPFSPILSHSLPFYLNLIPFSFHSHPILILLSSYSHPIIILLSSYSHPILIPFASHSLPLAPTRFQSIYKTQHTNPIYYSISYYKNLRYYIIIMVIFHLIRPDRNDLLYKKFHR
jgi:hypothetical protein